MCIIRAFRVVKFTLPTPGKSVVVKKLAMGIIFTLSSFCG